MSLSVIKNNIIPAIKTFVNAPIIKGDQTHDTPNEPYAAYKITSSYLKDVGKAEHTFKNKDLVVEEVYEESYKVTVSFTSYAGDDSTSFDLAQNIHDWFKFYGYETLNLNNVVVVEMSNVDNRDTLMIDEYERRNGFDVIFRLNRKITKQTDEYFDKIELNNQVI